MTRFERTFERIAVQRAEADARRDNAKARIRAFFAKTVTPDIEREGATVRPDRPAQPESSRVDAERRAAASLLFRSDPDRPNDTVYVHGRHRCIVCDWHVQSVGKLSPFHPGTVFPQWYGWDTLLNREDICSVCKDEIDKYKAEDLEPEPPTTWFKVTKDLTEDEQRAVAKWRKRAYRAKCTEEECDKQVELIRSQAEARFAPKEIIPAKDKVPAGYLELNDEHRKKTRYDAFTYREDNEDSFGGELDDVISEFALMVPNTPIEKNSSGAPLALDEQLALGSFDDYIDPDGGDYDADHDHGYNYGYRYHRFEKPPREDYNDPELFRDGLKESRFVGQGEGPKWTTVARRARKAWWTFMPTWREVISELRKQESAEKRRHRETEHAES